MGFLSRQNRAEKNRQKKEAQERTGLVEEFQSEYRKLRAKYGFDFRAFLHYMEDGSGIAAAMRIIEYKEPETEAEKPVEKIIGRKEKALEYKIKE